MLSIRFFFVPGNAKNFLSLEINWNMYIFCNATKYPSLAFTHLFQRDSTSLISFLKHFSLKEPINQLKQLKFDPIFKKKKILLLVEQRSEDWKKVSIHLI